jgi:hypothetical protein
VFPVGVQSGHGGNVAAFAVRAASGSQRRPDAAGSGAHSDARVLDLGKFFEPAVAVKNDADATTHDLQVETRDYATGRRVGIAQPRARRAAALRAHRRGKRRPAGDRLLLGRPIQSGGCHVRRRALRHDAVVADAAGAEFMQLATRAPEGPGREFYVWGREQGMHADTEFVRFRFRSSGPAAKLVFRAMTIFSRESAKAA